MGIIVIKAKRFWKTVSVAELENGFGILLDARNLMTPLKSKLIVPTKALAEQIAEEWRAVEGEINPELLPMTKRANSAIERVGTLREDVTSHLLDYVDSDLICYRAEEPKSLVHAQTAWDKWVEWAKGFDIDLIVTKGIMPVEQPASNRAAAEKWLSKWSDFEFTGVYDFITLNGSFILGMALAEKEFSTIDCFKLSIVDELFQESFWGIDEDALELREGKQKELEQSNRFFELTCLIE